MNYGTVCDKAHVAHVIGRWSAVALGFSIPISVALDNVLLVLVLIAWLIGGSYRQIIALLKDNPVATLCLALLGLLALGLLYGDRYPGDGLHYLRKYSHLLFVSLLMAFFRDEHSRRHGIAGFAAAMVLTLALSYLTAWGLMPQNAVLHGTPGNPVVFKLHITQNLLMAFATFLFATAARHETASGKRLLLAVLAALAAYNVLFMVAGRTGHVALAVLLVYFLFDCLRWRGLVAGLLAGAILATAAFNGSKSFHDRVSTAWTEFSDWQPGRAVTVSDSIGLRLEFSKNSLAIIRDHPVFGVGTGGFPAAYAEKIKNTGMVATVNPHNEYLLIAVQVGVLGTGLLLYIFYRQWRLAAELPGPFERDLAHGLLLTIIVGCLFNSLLIDHTEGLFYVWMSAVLYTGLNPPHSPFNKGGRPAGRRDFEEGGPT